MACHTCSEKGFQYLSSWQWYLSVTYNQLLYRPRILSTISQLFNRLYIQSGLSYAPRIFTIRLSAPNTTRYEVIIFGWTSPLKKLSMEAAGCFWRVNMLKSALSNVSVCERFQTPVDCVGRQAESAEKCVGRKVARERCSSVQDLILNSNRGIQCTQKLHVHVDFYTKKIVFENTVNISQNERLSQSQQPRNIAVNYVCTTQIAPPLRDNIRRAKTSFP